jgi:hypothetical protein
MHDMYHEMRDMYAPLQTKMPPIEADESCIRGQKAGETGLSGAILL